MWYKPSRRLHIFFLLSTFGHVAFFVWGLPWLATLPQGRPHTTPVRVAVVTPDTASRVMQTDVDAKPARPQPVTRPAVAPPPPPPPAPTPENVTKVRPQPPQPRKVAKVKPPAAQAALPRRRPRAVRRQQKVRKRPTPQPTVQKRQPVAPSPSPPLSQPATASAPAVTEVPMKAQKPPALPAGTAVAAHTESPARTPGKLAAVASLPPPQGWVPRFAYKPCPRYPYVARRRRVEGTVTLRFAVLPAGRIGDVEVVKSSGNPLLDSAAQKAVRKWRPLPGKGLVRDNTWVHVPFTFALTEQNGRNGHKASDVPAGRAAINCDARAKR